MSPTSVAYLQHKSHRNAQGARERHVTTVSKNKFPQMAQKAKRRKTKNVRMYRQPRLPTPLHPRAPHSQASSRMRAHIGYRCREGKRSIRKSQPTRPHPNPPEVIGDKRPALRRDAVHSIYRMEYRAARKDLALCSTLPRGLCVCVGIVESDFSDGEEKKLSLGEELSRLRSGEAWAIRSMVVMYMLPDMVLEKFHVVEGKHAASTREVLTATHKT
ncbi:hypothetical protein F5Y18DRAFT_75118 [Xylariaceae sp. FL1019]|nr:hypothetical protein F5Y18DRAFT_75118 [Xylariaceae sp. FL1019]